MSSLRAKTVSFAFIFQKQEALYFILKISGARSKAKDEVRAQEILEGMGNRKSRLRSKRDVRV